MTSTKPLRVAIIGGGLGGCTLAWGLRNTKNVALTIYEAGPEIKEQGIAIGVSRNAELALRLMGLDWEQLINDIGGVEVAESPVHLGKGPNPSDTIFILGKKGDQMMLSRAQLLQWIKKDLTDIPIETNKKVLHINEGRGNHPYELVFKDGSTATADAVIGCDGIHSKTREIILGENHAASQPVFPGMWECRGVVTMEQAQKHIGAEYLDANNPKVHGWAGDGGFMFAIAFGDNKMVALYVDGLTDEEGDPMQWSKTVPSSQIWDLLGGSFDHGRGILELLLEQPEVTVSQHWESAIAPTYFRDRICMIGDAAHAPVPWLSAGAGQTLEDCLVLSQLISRVQVPSDFETVFKVYDEVRRPRTQQVIEKSRQCGLIFCGKSPDVGLRPEELEAGVPPLFDYARNVDLEAHLTDALSRYDKISQGH